jgi:hypothetical protein
MAMNNINRDLLVVFNQTMMSPKALEREVSLLHEILHEVESLDNLAQAHEVLDLVKFKRVTKHYKVKEFFKMRSKNEKPFVFLNNKN